jgi:MraZ protein
MFIGEYEHALDGKNRLSLPRRFREVAHEAGEDASFFITRGLDECLFVFTSSQWDKVVAGLSTKPFTDSATRRFQRLFFSNAVKVDLDNQGRILVPDALKRVADLKKNVTLVGVYTRIEVWDRDRWNAIRETAGSEYESLAQQIYSPE